LVSRLGPSGPFFVLQEDLNEEFIYELAPSGVGSLAIAFDGVQRDGLRGARSLVTRMAIDALRALRDFERPWQIRDRDPKDIALLVLDSHRFSNFDYDNDRRQGLYALSDLLLIRSIPFFLSLVLSIYLIT